MVSLDICISSLLYLRFGPDLNLLVALHLMASRATRENFFFVHKIPLIQKLCPTTVGYNSKLAWRLSLPGALFSDASSRNCLFGRKVTSADYSVRPSLTWTSKLAERLSLLGTLSIFDAHNKLCKGDMDLYEMQKRSCTRSTTLMNKTLYFLISTNSIAIKSPGKVMLSQILSSHHRNLNINKLWKL